MVAYSEQSFARSWWYFSRDVCLCLDACIHIVNISFDILPPGYENHVAKHGMSWKETIKISFSYPKSIYD